MQQETERADAVSALCRCMYSECPALTNGEGQGEVRLAAEELPGATFEENVDIVAD